MAKSKQRTTFAIMRGITGFSAGEFADLVGKSSSTIQSIEAGRLKLSRELAEKVTKETGVNFSWLLDGDPSIEPTTEKGLPVYSAGPGGTDPYVGHHYPPFTRETFEKHRADLHFGDAQSNMDALVAHSKARLSGLGIQPSLAYAYRQSHLNAALYKFHKACEEFTKEISEKFVADEEFEHWLKHTVTSTRYPNGRVYESPVPTRPWPTGIIHAAPAEGTPKSSPSQAEDSTGD